MYGWFSLSLGMAVMKNLVSKIGKKYFGGFSGLLTVNIFTGAFAILFFLCLGLDFRSIESSAFWWIALSYGVCTTAAQMLHIAAVSRGDLSVCSMIYASGFLVSTMFSVFYFDETVGVLKAIGLVLICLSIFLISFQFQKKGEKTDKTEKKRGYQYLLFAFPAMIGCGLVGVFQKLFKAHCGSVGLNEFLFVAFSEMLVVSVVLKVWMSLVKIRRQGLALKNGQAVETDKAVKNELLIEGGLAVEGGQTLENSAVNSANSANSASKWTKKDLWLYAALATAFGVGIVVMGRLNLYLTGVMDGVIFFPLYNGSSIALTAAGSFLLLKEKPTVWKLVGIAIGICSFVLIAL
ncbi:MAG: EamA family transporter [Clostridia bacterium]|nr:EamA family transporter [Clostridia bacterium]